MSATATPVPTAPRRPTAGGKSIDNRSGSSRFPGPGGAGDARARVERPAAKDHEILFQRFFKSVGPRTYAAQVKRANNGNHFLVLMEGKRDEATAEVRKTRLFVYSEDFVEFFRLIKSAAEFVKANPVPDAVRQKRERFWARQPRPESGRSAGAPPAAGPQAAPAAKAVAR